jgi:hypothetical protein
MIRVMMIVTRRLGDRGDRRGHATAAGDGRARIARARELKVLPVCPALFAARITSPTKVFGRLVPRLPRWIRLGWTRKSLSRTVTVLCFPALQGARGLEMLGLFAESASAGC